MGIEGWSWAIGLVWIGQIGVSLRQLETRLFRSLSAFKRICSSLSDWEETEAPSLHSSISDGENKNEELGLSDREASSSSLSSPSFDEDGFPGATSIYDMPLAQRKGI